MIIHVCPLTRLHDTVAACSAGRIVTLLNAGTRVERPQSIRERDHLILSMHDIVEEMPDMVAPTWQHVESLVDFARSWNGEQPMVIHCFAGISRSTAAAYIVAATLRPRREELELAQALRRASPSATPNPRLIAFADELLGRNGRMISAIAEIGPGTMAMEGVPFSLALD